MDIYEIMLYNSVEGIVSLMIENDDRLKEAKSIKALRAEFIRYAKHFESYDEDAKISPLEFLCIIKPRKDYMVAREYQSVRDMIAAEDAKFDPVTEAMIKQILQWVNLLGNNIDPDSDEGISV